MKYKKCKWCGEEIIATKAAAKTKLYHTRCSNFKVHHENKINRKRLTRDKKWTSWGSMKVIVDAYAERLKASDLEPYKGR